MKNNKKGKIVEKSVKIKINILMQFVSYRFNVSGQHRKEN